MIRFLILLWCSTSVATAGPVVPGEAVCNLCSDAVQDLEAAITDETLHAKAMGKLEAVCSLVTSQRSEECNTVISGLSQEVLFHLMKDMKPMDLCMAMTACPANTDDRTQTVVKKPTDSGACELCSFLVEALNTYIEENSTQRQVNDTLQKLCGALPAPLATVCREDAPLVVAALNRGVDPTEVCLEIGLCAGPGRVQWSRMTCDMCARAAHFAFGQTEMCVSEAMKLCPKKGKLSVPQRSLPTAVHMMRAQMNNVTCELCEFLVQTVDALTKNKTSPAAANATAYKVCEVLPEPIKDTCITFAPMVVDMIVHGVDPVGACTNIGVCSTGPGRVQWSRMTCDMCARAAHSAFGQTEMCEAMKLCPKKGKLSVPQRSLPTAVHMMRAQMNNVTCELCEFLVQTVDALTKNKTSPAAANATAYKVCEVLPEPIKDTCITFAPMVVDMIVHGVDPVGACTNIGVCSTEPEVAEELQPPVNGLEAGPACELCELLVQTVDQYLKDNKTEAAINATVYKVCGNLPGALKDTCMTFAPQLVSILAKGADPKTACTDLKLCTNSTETRNTLRQTDVQAGPACELCELLVQTVDQYLKDNKTEAAINATVYKVCGDLPGTLKDTCMTFAPQLVSILAKGADPKTACTDIKLCTNSTEIRTSQRQTDVHLPSAGPACELCELLVQTVDQYLKDNKTEAAINATVYKVCGNLPGTLKDTCMTFAPQLVSILAKGADPKTACTDIKLCTNSTENMASAKRTTVQLPSAGPACELCELLVQTVDQYLKDNKTEAAINATVYKVCGDLPGTLKDTCMTFAPQLVSILAKGADPKTACTDIKLCTNSTESMASARRITVQLPSAGPACELCELLVQTVDQYLKDNKTEAAINATVYKVCGDLPGTLKDTCMTFAPQLVSILAKGADPKTACTDIKLCTNSTESMASAKRITVQLPSAGPACELCELLVQTVDQYLKDNKTEAAINATVYKVCGNLPGTLKDTCMTFAPQLVSILAKGADPKTACTDIKLCTNSTERMASARRITVQLPSAGPACELCELLVQTVDQYLKDNKTEAAINATIYKVCGNLPGTLKDTCMTFAPQLVSILAKGADPKTACTDIKLCTNSTERMASARRITVQLPSAGPACELCELLVQTVDQYLKDNKTEAAINATVYKVCGDLPGTLKDTCMTFAPQLVSILAKGADPKTACTTIKLCTNSTESMASARRDTAQLPSAGPACELCELLVQTVDQYLKDNKTEAAINATVYKVCGNLPGVLKDTCMSFAPQLVSILAKGADPKTACTAIKLCTNSTESMASARRITVQLPSAGPACELCELLVQTVDQYLKDNKTEAAINATVYKVCGNLPGALKDTCMLFAPQLVSILAKGADPKTACTDIKLCTNSTEVQTIAKKSADNRTTFMKKLQLPSAGPACELCELLVQSLDQYLKDNKSEAAINATVYKVCGSLPATLKDTCTSFAPQLVKALAAGVDPKQACTAVKLCDAKSKKAALMSRILLNPRSVAPAPNNSIWCTVCKNHIGIIDENLYRDEAKIQKVLDAICHQFPPPTDQACLNAVDGKFPEFWESFLNGTASPAHLCGLMDVCPKNSTLPFVL
ncbi:uncharacterized protein [Littorina saxatilis]|uniref:uncharacterized protein isoform X3 n=1 Tax=Littorina saxatilis TaxID=31220 RepID=UPI0038B6733F